MTHRHTQTAMQPYTVLPSHTSHRQSSIHNGTQSLAHVHCHTATYKSPIPHHYCATHSVTSPHPLSHPVTTGGSHTKKSLRQSYACTHSDPYRRTLSHTTTPWTVNLRRSNRSHGHTVIGGHPGTATAPSLPLPHLGHPHSRDWV